MSSGIAETIWPCDPHTAAKHEILKRYLDAWFPILGTTSRRVLFIDVFCGPGGYLNGEPGSPLVALNSALAHQDRLAGTEVLFRFIDERADRIAHLDSILDEKTLPKNFKVKTSVGAFDPLMRAVLDEFEGADTIGPTFAFIDPFGYKGMPMEVIHRLLKHPRTEVFINLMTSFISRHVLTGHDWVPAQFQEVFGVSDAAHQLQRNKGEEETRMLYHRALSEKAKFVRYFSMHDKHNRLIYDLFFASNSDLGFQKMKEAMWRVDPKGDFKFADATDPSQYMLFSDDPSESCLKAMRKRFAGQDMVPVRAIMYWGQNETGFLDSHLKAAVRLGDQNGRLTIRDIMEDGQPRPPH